MFCIQMCATFLSIMFDPVKGKAPKPTINSHMCINFN